MALFGSNSWNKPASSSLPPPADVQQSMGDVDALRQQVANLQEPSYSVRITASDEDDAGETMYAGTMVIPDGNGQWADTAALFTFDENPIYETNGRTIPTNGSAVVEVWPSAGGGYWECEYKAHDTYLAKTTSTVTARSGATLGSGTAEMYQASDDDDNGTYTVAGSTYTETIYNPTTSSIASGTYVILIREPYYGRLLVTGPLDPAAGSITFKKNYIGATWTVTTPNVTTIEVEGSDPYSLDSADPLNHTIIIKAAGAGNAGLMTTIAQTFAGVKTFNDICHFAQNSTFAVSHRLTQSTGYTQVEYTHSFTDFYTVQMVRAAGAGNTSQYQWNGEKFQLTGWEFQGAAGNKPYYSVYTFDDGNLDGVYTTLPGGATVSGGIITDEGTDTIDGGEF